MKFAPEYERAATLLKGFVKMVEVDVTSTTSIASKYATNGVPSIRIFGTDKSNPVEYTGQHTGDAIAAASMKLANQMVKERMKPTEESTKKDSTQQSSTNKETTTSKPAQQTSSKPTSKKSNKKDTLINNSGKSSKNSKKDEKDKKSNRKRESKSADKDKGDVNKKNEKSTTKSASKKKNTDKTKTKTKTKTEEKSGSPKLKDVGKKIQKSPAIFQLTSQRTLEKTCPSQGSDAAKICVIMFVPQIYDSSAKDRERYLATLAEVAKGFRSAPLSFLWSEGTAQPALEQALGINFGFPTVAVVSMAKKVYAVQKVSWSTKNIKSFLSGVIAGR